MLEAEGRHLLFFDRDLDIVSTYSAWFLKLQDWNEV